MQRSPEAKDGAGGMVWPFRLRNVTLGIDADGDPLSSCVIEHTDDLPPGEGTSKQKPTGKYEPIVLEELRKMVTPEAPHVDAEDLYNAALKKLAPDESAAGRDMRKRNAKRGLEGLVAKHLAFMQEGRVSLSSAETADGAEFDGSTPEFLT